MMASVAMNLSLSNKNKEDCTRLGGPLSSMIYKQWVSKEDKDRRPVTAAGGRNLLPNVPLETGRTKARNDDDNEDDNKE